jgi:hypothetical protein
MAQVPQTAAVFKMTLPNYLFLVTIEHGYLLVTPQDIHTILPIDPETQIPRLSSSLDLTQQPVTDSIGNQWILLEEDCQVPEFIELLADKIRTFPHQIRERIKRYEPNISSAELVRYVQSNNMNQIFANH